jgi:hypothetical protein
MHRTSRFSGLDSFELPSPALNSEPGGGELVFGAFPQFLHKRTSSLLGLNISKSPLRDKSSSSCSAYSEHSLVSRRRTAGVRFLTGVTSFALPKHAQTASYPPGIWGYFCEGTATGAWSDHTTSLSAHFISKFPASHHDMVLRDRKNFTFTISTAHHPIPRKTQFRLIRLEGDVMHLVMWPDRTLCVA